MLDLERIVKSAGLKAVALSCLLSAVQISCAQSAEDPVLASPGAATQIDGNVATTSLHDAMASDIKTAFSHLAPGLQAAPLPATEASSPLAPAKEPGQSPPGGASPQAPSVGDLGFPVAQTQPNPAEQARLDKRSHMLKMHQRLGLITAVPLVATVIAGGFAGGRSTDSTTRDLHAGLGSLTAGLYLTTAYYSIFAPRIPGTRTRGPIRLHKALAWIHGPGMILTPVLGAMAFDQKSRGEKVHGIASAHGAVAVVTAAAYGLAIVSVSVKF